MMLYQPVKRIRLNGIDAFRNTQKDQTAAAAQSTHSCQICRTGKYADQIRIESFAALEKQVFPFLFHAENDTCSAGKIQVGNGSANRAEDTCCDTFKAKE